MSRFVQILTIFLFGGAISASPAPVSAQTPPRPALRAIRVAVPPKLDGLLDDEAWARPALPLGTWISYNPMRGEPAAQRTDVWVAYDNSAIYFAFKCFDSEPGKIRTTIRILADFLASYELSPGTLAHAGYGSLFENPDAVSYAATARALFFKVSYLASF